MATIDTDSPPERRAAALHEQGYSPEQILRVTGCDVRLLTDDELRSAPDEGEPPLREQARAMRRHGAHLHEIAERLGVARSTAYNWTLGVVDRRPTSARERREVRMAEARRLRGEGLSYKRIATRLGASVATVHGWTRDVQLPEGAVQAAGRSPEELREINRRRWASQHEVDERERASVARTAAGQVGDLAARDLLLLGAMAYWCEGSKAKPWAPHRQQVRFVNSDPTIIRLFLRFLAVAGVPRERIQYRVSIHETADVVAAQAHWAAVVGAPPESFMSPTIKRHKPLTKRKNTGEQYRGCLVVHVLDGRRLYWHIDALMTSMDRASGGQAPTSDKKTSMLG